MYVDSVDDDEPFLTWPDINVFPRQGNGTRESFLHNFEFAMTFLLLPSVSVLGVAGNVMSILVLLRRGLHKCSNILIFALAVADTLYLVGSNNIALQIYTSEQNFGFYSSERVAEFLFAMYHFEIAMESIGKVVSLILPSCITFERLVAVYFPLHLSRILTPLRIWVTVGVLYLFGVSAYVQYQLRFRFMYGIDPATNRSVGLIVDSEIINRHAQYYAIIRQTYMFTYGPFPVAFSLVGCLLIGYKIRFHDKKRKRLMNVKNTCEKKANCDARNSNLSYVLTRFKKRIFCKKTGLNDSMKQSTNIVKRKSCNSIEVSDNTIEYKSQSGDIYFPSEQAPHSPEKLLACEKSSCHQSNTSPTADLSSRNSQESNEITPRKNTTKHHKIPQNTSKHKSPKKSLEDATIGTVRGVKLASKSLKRTTRTLLTVCVVYTVIGLFNFVALVYIKYCGCFRVDTSMVVELFRKLGLSVNSACNFVIYVGLNRNFRDTYREIFCRCSRR